MSQAQREKLIYLRQWVGDKVHITTADAGHYDGILTNIVFDGTRLMYVMIDDQTCLNYQHIIEIRLSK